MSKKTQGGVSHSVCMAYFTSLGHIVSFPLFDDAPYDLLADDGNDIFKIQCKTATGSYFGKTGYKRFPHINFRSDANHKPVYVTSFDYLWAMTRQFCYLIPSVEIPHDDDGLLRSISVNPVYDSFIVNLPFLAGKDQERDVFRSPLTTEEVERMKSLYLSGETPRSIGKIMGIADYKIEYYLLRNDIRKGHFLTEDIKDRIKEMYQSGESVPNIAFAVGFSKTAVSNVLTESGLSRKEPVIKMEWKPEIIQMYKDGFTPSAIAKKFGIKRPNTISSFLHHQKWLVTPKNDSITTSVRN